MKKERGFSLVELMVAIVIGLILVAGVIELFINNRQMYRVQDNYARLQENGRYALSILGDAIESTGFSGCSSRSGNDLQNTLTSFTQLQRDYDTLITGHAYQTSNWSPVLPTDIQTKLPLPNSDILTIRNIQSPDARITGSSGNQINVNNDSGFKEGDFVLAHDCEISAVFELNGVGSNTLTITADSAAFDYEFKAGARVHKIDTNTFFIRENPNNQPALYRFNSALGLTELIDGIEAIKLQFGISETGDNGSADYYASADGISATEWDGVVSVRISLLLVSSERNLTTSEYTFSDDSDFSDYTVEEDGRLRRVVSRTITLRNRTP